MLNNNIKNYDPDLWELLNKENYRQENHIELIASENYASACVMEAQGSKLTNKYAEGYPKKRYYGGCKYIDEIENLAITRAKKLFNADYVNVQPHSGSQANFAVYTALLSPGDCVLGMHLNHGGHLTHGSPANLSGKLYNFIAYGVDNKGNIDYSQIEYLAKKNKPKMIIGGFSAYSGSCNWSIFRKIADSINAYLLVDMAHIAGLVAANLYPNPIPYAHVVTSTTHKTLAGPRGGLILSNAQNKLLYKKLDSFVFPGTQGGPLMHVIAAKAVAFKEALEPAFKSYQQQVVKNSKTMVKFFIEHKYKIVTEDIYNHLFLLDLTNNNITGKEAENILSLANIIVNKNTVPNETKSPFITSGIRIGTPAITRRGFKEKEARTVAKWIINILDNISSYRIVHNVKNEVLKLCSNYPVYNVI